MADDDLDGLEDDDLPAEQASDPKHWEKEVRKARKEAEGLRKRLRERESEVLAARFTEDDLKQVPEWVSDFDQRTELAEKFRAAREAVTENTETQPVETPVEAPTAAQVPEGLKAMTGSPPATSAAPNDVSLSAAELTTLYKTDPAEATRLARIKFGQT